MDSLPIGIVLKSGLYTYIIEEVLGQGSFGITYLASVQMLGSLGTIKSNQKVAIKEFFMRDQNGRDGSTVTYSTKREICDEYRSKFINEAVKLASLNHPNIIKVMDAFECNETSYYVMEYHADGSLNDFISKNGNPGLSAETVLHLISVIAEALGHMHSSNMIHLDLKPDNILMQGSDDVVLIDFGLSKQYDENGEPESSTMIKGGTPGYMPLEQCAKIDSNGLPVTLDIYALGATMYKMLTGQRPPEAYEVLNDGLPTPPSAIDKNVWSLVGELMSPKKQDRPQTIPEVLNKLNALKMVSSEEDEQTVRHEEETIVKDTTNPDIDEENPDSYFQLGLDCMELEDYDEAIEWFSKCAAEKDIEAFYQLGKIYVIQEDYYEALPWLRKAASKNHVEAQYELAKVYQNHCYEESKAKYWYKRAANQNHSEAQEELDNWSIESSDNEDYSDGKYDVYDFIGDTLSFGEKLKEFFQQSRVRVSMLILLIVVFAGGLIFYFRADNSKSKSNNQEIELADSITVEQPSDVDVNEELSSAKPSNISTTSLTKSKEEVKSSTKSSSQSEPQVVEKSNNSSEIVQNPEQPAEFPGGTAGLMRFLSNNLSYPAAALENDIQGKVYVQFVIEKDGSVSSPIITKSVDEYLDREALRVVKCMPRWRPGKKNGESVRTYFSLPVTFRLTSD